MSLIRVTHRRPRPRGAGPTGNPRLVYAGADISALDPRLEAFIRYAQTVGSGGASCVAVAQWGRTNDDPTVVVTPQNYNLPPTTFVTASPASHLLSWSSNFGASTSNYWMLAAGVHLSSTSEGGVAAYWGRCGIGGGGTYAQSDYPGNNCLSIIEAQAWTTHFTSIGSGFRTFFGILIPAYSGFYGNVNGSETPASAFPSAMESTLYLGHGRTPGRGMRVAYAAAFRSNTDTVGNNYWHPLISARGTIGPDGGAWPHLRNRLRRQTIFLPLLAPSAGGGGGAVFTATAPAQASAAAALGAVVVRQASAAAAAGLSSQKSGQRTLAASLPAPAEADLAQSAARIMAASSAAAAEVEQVASGARIMAAGVAYYATCDCTVAGVRVLGAHVYEVHEADGSVTLVGATLTASLSAAARLSKSAAAIVQRVASMSFSAAPDGVVAAAKISVSVLANTANPATQLGANALLVGYLTPSGRPAVAVVGIAQRVASLAQSILGTSTVGVLGALAVDPQRGVIVEIEYRDAMFADEQRGITIAGENRASPVEGEP